MDMLKKFFPFAFTKKADVVALVINIIVHLVVGFVIGFVIGLVAKLPPDWHSGKPCRWSC